MAPGRADHRWALARASTASRMLVAALLLATSCTRFGYSEHDEPGAVDARDAAVLDSGSSRDAQVSSDGSRPDASPPPDASSIADAAACEGAIIDVAMCDDGVACTADEAALDPMNCQTICSHRAVDSAAMDGCCSPGRNANTDPDCVSVCGNGVVEPGEVCDGDGRCFQSCMGALPLSLRTRYSFEGTEASARDSIGGKDGTLVNAALNGQGGVDLGGEESAAYVDLPDDLLSGLTNATFEAWVNWDGGTIVDPDPHDSWKWQRIFDFGRTNGTAGTSYIFLTPLQESTLPHVGAKATGQSQTEVSVDGSAPFPMGQLAHAAVVFDDDANLLSLYVDGELVGSVTISLQLTSIAFGDNWLGRSLFDVDRYFAGSIEEFRIYDAALNSDEIKDSYDLHANP